MLDGSQNAVFGVHFERQMPKVCQSLSLVLFWLGSEALFMKSYAYYILTINLF